MRLASIFAIVYRSTPVRVRSSMLTHPLALALALALVGLGAGGAHVGTV